VLVADVVAPVPQPQHELVDGRRRQMFVGEQGIPDVPDLLVADGRRGQVADLVLGPILVAVGLDMRAAALRSTAGSAVV
jgi:hypothetical protein